MAFKSNSLPISAPQKPRFSAYRRLSEEVDLLKPRPSIILPQLSDNEKKFFDLVALGDVVACQEFLNANPGFNINCVNFQGVSALLVAVQSHSEAMVELLLSKPNIDIGDCALHAVKENLPKILVMILDMLNITSPSLEFVGVTHSSDFPDHVTPLILASQCGHFEIIEILLKRGHVITKPHPPNCTCHDCRGHFNKDDVLHAESLRLNLYRAVSNPAYICHSTHDPILAAFNLSTELRTCSQYVPEFRSAYVELAEEVAEFAVDLIGCCRSTNEVELLLLQSAGLQRKSAHIFPRLTLAMIGKQKKFVAHTNTQQIVEAVWQGDWHEYRLRPAFVRLFVYPLLRIVLLPIIFFLTLFTPGHSLVKHFNIPLNKMLSHAAGYSIFLVLIFLESNISKENQKRSPPDSGLEPAIIVFVVGYVWGDLRMCLLEGLSKYFRSLWNWHSLICNFFFVLTFVFWGASYFDALQNDQVDLERKYWHSLDPLLIAEGTFAVATIMAFFKLMFFCRLNYYLGPLQISLGKMCADMAKYITLFVIIIISFSAGMCRFYQYYDSMVQVDSNGMKTQQVSSFVDFSKTLKTFFWAIFCMSDLGSGDVVIENLPGETESTTIINKHEFTEAIGFIVFALFEVLTVIMILNMLIATMSSTFQRVIDNLDVEWTFGKTDFYLEYFLESTLPSPFNLIPTPAGITKFWQMLNPKEEDLVEKSDHEYPALMSLIVQRYFREKDSANMAASEMDCLKQEIHELKALLQEIVEGKD